MWPEIRFSDNFALPTYLVYLSLLFTAFVLILPWYARRKNKNIIDALNIGTVMMVVGFIGARLFHVFYEDWPLYSVNPERIFYVWLGGFVFLGGAIPAVIAMYLYMRWKKLPAMIWLDFFTPVGAIGYGLGRISCFLAGCCYGAYCDLPWAVNGRHPTQLYATFWELAVAFVLIKFEAQILKKLQSGGIFWTWVLLHGVGRVMIEGLRVDFRGPLLFGFSISSLLSLVLVTLGMYHVSLRLMNSSSSKLHK